MKYWTPIYESIRLWINVSADCKVLCSTFACMLSFNPHIPELYLLWSPHPCYDFTLTSMNCGHLMSTSLTLGCWDLSHISEAGRLGSRCRSQQWEGQQEEIRHSEKKLWKAVCQRNSPVLPASGETEAKPLYNALKIGTRSYQGCRCVQQESHCCDPGIP